MTTITSAPLPASVAAAIQRTGERLASLDLSLTEDQAGSLREAEQAEAGAGAGQQRLRDIHDELIQLEKEGPDPKAAAAALVAGDSVMTKLRSPELLRQEQEAIQAGMADLNERARRSRAVVDSAHRRAARQVAAAVDAEVAPALEEEMRRLVAEMATLYAVAKAFSHGADGVRVRHFADTVGAGLNAIRRGSARSSCKLVETHGDIRIDVPSEVAEALEPAAPTLAAVQQHIPGAVPFANY